MPGKLAALLSLAVMSCGPGNVASVVTPDPDPEIALELGECPYLARQACCESEFCELPPAEEFGGAGENCAGDEPRDEPAACPCIPGFEKLGAKGKKCTVDGPGKQGNGTAEVVENSCHKIAIKMNTGYLDATFTIERTKVAPCSDTLSVDGKIWNNDKSMLEPKKASGGATIKYDCDKKKGTITTPDGKGGNTTEEYSTDGGGDFHLSFGGYDHEFENCK